MTTYNLVAAPPTRTMAICAVGDVIGAVLLVLGLDRGLPVLTVAGIVVLGLGIGLLVVAVVLRARVRTVVELDGGGITVSSGGTSARAGWPDITGVTTDGSTLYLDRKPADGPPLKIGSPRGASDREFTRLAEDITARLDRDRGYRPLDG